MSWSHTTPESELHNLIAFVGGLDFAERKALITLARSQSIPNPDTSPILFSKTKAILDKLVVTPPFESLSDHIREEGWTVIRLLSSPLTTGLLIVYALGVNLTDSQVLEGKRESFYKELNATQTARREGEWNWRAVISPVLYPREIIHPLFPSLSPLQRTFASRLPSFIRSYRNRIILPHYTNRGVSSQTAGWLLNRVSKSATPKWGNPQTFHRQLDRRNVVSRDVVHHYVRDGRWAAGLTEMKQRWYPSGLLPRTYFSWSGRDIAVSSYLRNFFNDLCDQFSPTDRHNRVQPDWLQARDRRHLGFLFYDLTSFTSWFHEQVPFLRALADRFRNNSVFLVGEGLTLSEHDLGSLIDAYTDYTTDFADFVVNGSTVGVDYSERTFTHQCAGFLGIPGNLATCTLAHGLAIASMYTEEREIQVPGDDVGASYRSAEHMRDIGTCASTLGYLQFDKVFHLPQISVYLKRLVVDLGASIRLAPMLIFPLLPYLINPQTTEFRSNRFRLPDRSKLHSRAAHVLVSFHRDLWRHTRGDFDSQAEGIILLFLRKIHDQIGLPRGAIFQGRVYGSDDPETDRLYADISVKFSVDDDRCLRWNPDLHFASKYVTRMTIRDTSEVRVRRDFEKLHVGESFCVRNSRGWRFLEDMGYVRLGGIPGEKIELIGSDARDAFLFASEPPLREVEVLCDLETYQLVAAGVAPSPQDSSFLDPELSPGVLDLNLQSWRYRRYVDLDDMRSAGAYGRSREWVVNGLASTRSSLSPEPDRDLDY
jgi:hypothetical protein